MDCFKFQVAKFPPKRRRNGFEGAMEAGLGLAGFQKTKAGHDDKEVAYIVRQNWCFKCICTVLVLLGLVFAYVFSTTLRIEVFRRDAIDEEIKHRVSEHGAQMKLVSVRVELKDALNNQIHQHHRLEEYKSLLARLFGDTEDKLNKFLTSLPSKDLSAKIITLFHQLQEPAQEDLEKMLWEFHLKSEKAQQTLNTISNSIINDIAEDTLEQNLYKKKMKELGINAKAAITLEKESVNPSELRDRDEANLFREVERQNKESRRTVDASLDKFFQKIENMKFPLIDGKTIIAWDKYLASVVRTLHDSNKDTDLEGIIRNVHFMMSKYPLIKQYSGKDGQSIVDYLKITVYEAKLAAHKQELLELNKKWKNGVLSTMQVLSKVEKVAQEHLDDWIST